MLFHRQLLDDLLTARYDDALLMAARNDDSRTRDEEMKVCVRGGRVVDIAKTITPDEADGENIGIAKFGAGRRRGAGRGDDPADRRGRSPRLAARAPSPPSAGGARCTWSRAAGFPWIEIDFPEDYWRACTDVLPAIDAASSAATAAVPRRPFHV